VGLIKNIKTMKTLVIISAAIVVTFLVIVLGIEVIRKVIDRADEEDRNN
jgi:uncharacterized membrane protein